MVKVIINKLSILMVLLFMSCSGIDYKKDKYNIIINPYDHLIEVDFNHSTIKIDYGYFKYSDSLNLSKEDKDKIIYSFEQNIGGIRGEYHYYNDTLIVMDGPNDFRLKSYKNKELLSDISIAYVCENKGYISFGKKYRVTKFRDEVMLILSRNQRYQKAIKIASENGLWSPLLKHGNDTSK